MSSEQPLWQPDLSKKEPVRKLKIVRPEQKFKEKRGSDFPETKSAGFGESVRIFLGGTREPKKEKLTEQEKAIRNEFDKVAKLLGISIDEAKYLQLDKTLPVRDAHFYEKIYFDAVLAGYREFLSPRNYLGNQEYRDAIKDFVEYVSTITSADNEQLKNIPTVKTFEYLAQYKGKEYDYKIEVQRIGARIVDVKAFRVGDNKQMYLFGSHLPMRKSLSIKDPNIIREFEKEFKQGFASVSNMRKNFKNKKGKIVDKSWGQEQAEKLQEIVSQLEKIRK